jgi:hypothetical protein
MQNADLDTALHLPMPPEVIAIDDEDNNPPLPNLLRTMIQYLPKIEPEDTSKELTPQ